MPVPHLLFFIGLRYPYDPSLISRNEMLIEGSPSQAYRPYKTFENYLGPEYFRSCIDDISIAKSSEPKDLRKIFFNNFNSCNILSKV